MRLCPPDPYPRAIRHESIEGDSSVSCGPTLVIQILLVVTSLDDCTARREDQICLPDGHAMHDTSDYEKEIGGRIWKDRSVGTDAGKIGAERILGLGGDGGCWCRSGFR